MAEWRLFRGWTSAELRERLNRLPGLARNFAAPEEEMTGDLGWRHYHSEAVIAVEPDGATMFERARQAVATYQFSDPDIVVAHLDPDAPLLLRRLLLEIRILGLRYLCPAGDRLLLVNLGADRELQPAPEPLLAPPAAATWHAAFCSEDVKYGGKGFSSAYSEAGRWRLDARSATFFIARERDPA